MRLAWGCSIAAQALLCWALWRAGKLDWWLAYLAVDIPRSLILWPFEPQSHGYYWPWVLSELAVMALQIAAVDQATAGTNGRWAGVGVGIGAFAWSINLTAATWPTGRRAALLLSQAGAYWCLGVLLAAWADGRRRGWLLALYGIMSAWQVSQQIAQTQAGVQSVSTHFVWAVTVLYFLWGRSLNYGRIRAK